MSYEQRKRLQELLQMGTLTQAQAVEMHVLMNMEEAELAQVVEIVDPIEPEVTIVKRKRTRITH